MTIIKIDDKELSLVSGGELTVSTVKGKDGLVFDGQAEEALRAVIGRLYFEQDHSIANIETGLLPASLDSGTQGIDK